MALIPNAVFKFPCTPSSSTCCHSPLLPDERTTAKLRAPLILRGRGFFNSVALPTASTATAVDCLRRRSEACRRRSEPIQIGFADPDEIRIIVRFRFCLQQVRRFDQGNV